MQQASFKLHINTIISFKAEANKQVFPLFLFFASFFSSVHSAKISLTRFFRQCPFFRLFAYVFPRLRKIRHVLSTLRVFFL